MNSVNAIAQAQPNHSHKESRIKRSLAVATSMGIVGGGVQMAFDAFSYRNQIKETGIPWKNLGKSGLFAGAACFVFSLCLDAVLSMFSKKD